MNEAPYEAPEESDLSFGDIFEAGFLFDAYLRGDVISLGKDKAHPSRGVGDVYSGLFHRKPDDDYLLSHGRQCAGIVLSDSCTIDKNVGISRPAKVHGRMMLAAVAVASPDQIRAEADKNRYSRLALPEHPDYPGGIVDFEKVFSLDLRDAIENKERRVVRLSDRLASELVVRWTAHMARRGPWAAAVKTTAAIDRFANLGTTFDNEQAVVLAVSGLVDAVWEFQGAHLDGVEEELDEGRTPSEVLDTWIEQLKSIGLAAENAVDQLVNNTTALSFDETPASDN
jgi:hypothetical protein